MKTAITPTRTENFAEWYQNVIAAADLAENSPSAGCMTVKPYGWAIWELMQSELDRRIKAEGVRNVQFPTLIPLDFLAKEADHVEGFAKESMIVTHSRLKMIDGKLQADPESKLTEPYIMRPTSETIIGEAVSRWIESYRDLPMKLNQWCSVFRWEMRPRLFLRTREFFWQEGHNVFATAEEAKADALRMHKVYTDYCREWLAIESVVGEKTVEERFAGADNTYTREQIMQDGKAVQMGTSHYLGQHFSKAMNIQYLGADGQKHFAYTTSWGITSRLIGNIIMHHGDDDGLLLPPTIAPYQVVIIPILPEHNKYAHEIAAGINARVLVDDGEDRSSDKMWKWIKRGVPLRIEIGDSEAADKTVTITRRDLGKSSKTSFAAADVNATVQKLLSEIQSNLLDNSRKLNKKMIHEIADLTELRKKLTDDVIGFFRLPYNATLTPEFDAIMDEFKITRRCLDERDPTMVFVAKAY